MARKKDGKKRVIFTTSTMLLLIIGVCFLFIPLFRGLKFGLDLQGGFEVLYKIESIDGKAANSSLQKSTYKTLSKRIDSLGVSEPEIILEGTDKIRVKLAGVSNPDEARSQLSTVASLTFRDTNDNLLMTSDVLQPGGAKIGQDSSGNPAVSLAVKDKDKFFEVTNAVKDYEDSKNMIVIWLDFNELSDSYSKEGSACGSKESNCLSAATVSQGFASDVIIQGNFTEEEVSNLVDLINSGSLPCKLVEISSKTVGASFGDDTLQKTLLAGIIGILLIATVLIVVYRFSGLISTISMLLYAFLVFLIFWLIGGVLTLPGIAALVLGIGMAVDSNVITFSRIKDELYKGKGLASAFKEGSKSSFSAILDSNLTTLLVAIVMFIFGESSIKGFATMLIITVLVTMFTMVFITRKLLGVFVKTSFFDNKLKTFINVKSDDVPDVSKNEKAKERFYDKVNFLGKSKLLSSLSLIIIIIGSITILLCGLNLGIDYKAGTNITIDTTNKITKKDLKHDLAKLELKYSNIDYVDDEITIRVDKSIDGEKVKNITSYFEDKYEAKVNIGVVSNLVKKELVKNAILSVIIALIVIVLYVSIRFKFSYAISGVLALAHDVLIIFALFGIFHIEINSMFIAAVLAIIGYSINNTIVIFDRIREELTGVDYRKLTKEGLINACNKCVQATFTRSIYTTITTIIPVVALIILGSREILTFNIAMLIGLIAGTYSSVFISPFLFTVFEKRNLGKEIKKKRVYTDSVKEKNVKGVNC